MMEKLCQDCDNLYEEDGKKYCNLGNQKMAECLINGKIHFKKKT